MLEDIRRQCMVRNEKKYVIAGRLKTRFTKRAHAEIEKMIDGSMFCERWMARHNKHEIKFGDVTVSVDMNDNTCGCRKWQMIGIPCIHDASVIIGKKEKVEDYVAEWYTARMWQLTYIDGIGPVQGKLLWPRVNRIGVLPPPWRRDVNFYPKTESWVNKSDCCSWDGITCAAKSGNVIGIDLSSSNLHGPLKSKSILFRMRHLRDLNLAYNNFTGSPIPAEFDKLMELKRLSLSQSSLSGQIPINLLQLTKLVSLDLSFSSLSIDGTFLYLLAQNLRNLRELDMSDVNISSEIPDEFSNMRSLRSLHLSYCNLSGEFPSSVLLIPSLESIRLRSNPNLRGNLPVFRENNSFLELSIYDTAFSGPIPDSISSLRHLTSLTLFVSKFSGKIPISLGNLSHLAILDLGGNNFVGEIPSSIGNLKQLTVFDVSSNKLNGNLPVSILNFTQLRKLGLSSNQFTGFLPPNISQFSKLESFQGGDDSFTGDILSSLLKISSLTDIYLIYNKFSDFTGSGNISLFLPNLRYFSIESTNYNKVIGPGVDLNVFSPLKKLYWLLFLGIPLSTTNITSDSDFLPNLAYLFLPGCNITEFPEFIRNGRKLRRLDLSNNIIKGQVPDWLWRLPKLFEVNLSNNSLSGFNGSSKVSPESQISTVDLSSNALQGPLFIPSSKHLQYFLGSKNNFTEEIPRSICGLSYLQILDLSDNKLNGSIPWCLETIMSSLSDLNLRNNKLSGILPEIFQNAKSLITLDVSHNRLEGKIPASLGGCSALEVLNVGSNTFNDMFPFHLNSLQKLQVLVLRSNKFHGKLHNSDGVWFGFPQLKIIDVSHNHFFGTLPSDYFLNWTVMFSNRDNDTEPKYIKSPSGSYYFSLVLMNKGISMEMERILTIYTAIDFSGNQLNGPIPDSIGLLKELRILNLSNNAFTGHIPSTMANLTNLESLDLSQNKISGEIPSELGALSSLEVINVSHNQLVGSIPQGTQFQRQNCSSYEGNPGLNGPSLKDVCRDIKTPTPPQPELVATKEEEESFSWMAAGLGFAPGVVFGLVMGYIAVSYKHEWWFMKRFGRNKQ
ncbi:PREDICTED: receptor-like protein 12 [Camelina sativa]|uniref:Receptor-like protein 12 n=1 Tax=Camelina sativa TaxID=90675 RepID=A0ABM0VWR1_CAMSA|nr:PREDICTED: receptor-like protein 12 [Camelina sativa]